MFVDPFASINWDEVIKKQNELNRHECQKISSIIYEKLVNGVGLNKDEKDYLKKINDYKNEMNEKKSFLQIFKEISGGKKSYLYIFSKKASRQNIYEKEILNSGLSLEGKGIIELFNKPEKVFQCQEKLYISHGKEIWLKRKPNEESRSIDFAIKLMSGKLVFCSHKFGTVGGGSQNQQRDELGKKFMKDCHNGKHYYLAIGDGPYYTAQVLKSFNDKYGNEKIIATNKNNLYNILKIINES